jgi:hypothetical protein
VGQGGPGCQHQAGVIRRPGRTFHKSRATTPCWRRIIFSGRESGAGQDEPPTFMTGGDRCWRGRSWAYSRTRCRSAFIAMARHQRRSAAPVARASSAPARLYRLTAGAPSRRQPDHRGPVVFNGC